MTLENVETRMRDKMRVKILAFTSELYAWIDAFKG